jgi:VIT1/CCC1 family predicted Fe2+/Mn2+ transporter
MVILEWFIESCRRPLKPLNMHLARYPIGSMRALFFGGAFSFFGGFWYFLHSSTYYQGYAIWMAAFAATLASLFIFAVVSAQIHGYRSYRDPWLGTATGIMFAFSLVLVFIGAH